MGAWVVLVNVPDKEIVKTYFLGLGIMGFITATGLIILSLSLLNVIFKVC